MTPLTHFNLPRLVEFADLPPHGKKILTLAKVLKPLHTVAPIPLSAAIARHMKSGITDDLTAAKRIIRNDPQAAHESFFRSQIHPARLDGALEQYRKRLPPLWVDWVFFTHEVYYRELRADFPLLLDAFEALIRVEAQLQVSADHANRDHVLHQLADGFLASHLVMRWQKGAAGTLSNQPERRALMSCLDALGLPNPLWDDTYWGDLVRAGLCVAGLFHDIGYVRYVAEAGVAPLRKLFGHSAAVVAPEEPQRLAELLWNSLLHHLFAERMGPSSPESAISLLVELYNVAWDKQWHGPLSAGVLLATASDLRLAGRQSPEAETVLQLAAAAAFLHEVHPVKDEKYPIPAVARARQIIEGLRLPLLFRLVDELHCAFRPELLANLGDRLGRSSKLEFGVDEIQIGVAGKPIVLHTPLGENRKGRGERDSLNYLFGKDVGKALAKELDVRPHGGLGSETVVLAPSEL